jgi:hypothetical protein
VQNRAETGMSLPDNLRVQERDVQRKGEPLHRKVLLLMHQILGDRFT